MSEMMRVYLAGKINGTSGWRNALVPGWSDVVVRVKPAATDDNQRRECHYEIGGESKDGIVWPVLPGGFLGIADCVGPFGIAWRDDDAWGGHGDFREPPGSLHRHADPNGPYKQRHRQRRVVTRCLDTIKTADVVVAVVTGPSPGLLCELGYAYARHKPIIAFVRSGSGFDWFPRSMCQSVTHVPDGPGFVEQLVDALCVTACTYDEAGLPSGLFVTLARTTPRGIYYRSPWWKRRRELAIVRSGRKCQLCSATAALEVHHNSYDRIYREPDSDLVVLCDPCHVTADVRRRAQEKATV